MLISLYRYFKKSKVLDYRLLLSTIESETLIVLGSEIFIYTITGPYIISLNNGEFSSALILGCVIIIAYGLKTLLEKEKK